MFKNVETKVYTAMAGAGAGGVIGQFILWWIGTSSFGQPSDANHSVQAIAAVPAPLSAVVGLGLTLIGAFLGGYSGPHTSRPDLHATPIDQALRSMGFTPPAEAPAAQEDTTGVTPEVHPAEDVTPAVTPESTPITPAAGPDYVQGELPIATPPST